MAREKTIKELQADVEATKRKTRPATKVVRVTIHERTTVRQGGRAVAVIEAGTYPLRVPTDYDPAEITAEDMVFDNAIRVIG